MTKPGNSIATVVIAVIMVTVVIGVFLVGKAAYKNSVVEKSTSEFDNAPANMQQDNLMIFEKQEAISSALLAYYVSNQTYPSPDKESWEQFVRTIRENIKKNAGQNQDPFIDPITNETYTFTDASPTFGQIQYRFPASCDEQSNEFLEVKKPLHYAFRLTLPNGNVSCFGNL